MPIQNPEISETFRQLASLLEIEGANPFRIRAYVNAALTISNLSRSLAEMIAAGEDPASLPGIGRELAEKIRELAATGRLSALEEIKTRLPEGLLDLLKIQGLGPKRVRSLKEKLAITDLPALAKAARAGRLRALSGFGEKLEAQILNDVEQRQNRPVRFTLDAVAPLAEALLARLRKIPGVSEASIAGSYRRAKETVGDLDMLVTGAAAAPVLAALGLEENIAEILSHGDTRSTVRFRSGLQVDLRLVPPESYGAALQYFTGSQAHNIALRKRGRKKNLTINEYGAFKGPLRVAGRTEAELYAAVGLPYIEPELRENQGEIEAGLAGKLPRLLTLPDIRGDLHAHTLETDGASSLEDMAEAARARGYAYLGITDHSQRVGIARGMDAKRLARQMAAIDKLNLRWKNFVLLKGVEVDILEDGRLDLPDEILAELDYTVCSVHFRTNLNREKQTERILRAMDNPYFSILGHPSGRLLGERDPMELDMERLLRGAKERGCCLELNSNPARLDLTDVHCRRAGDLGVNVAVSTDAHHAKHLDFIRFGLGQARRGWLEAKNVLNTRPLKKLLPLLKRL